MKERIKWIEYKGKKILYIDYSGLHHDQMMEVLGNVWSFYEGQPKNSMLSLADLSNSYAHSETYNAFKELTKKTAAYDLKSASVGLSTAKKIFLRLINRFSNPKIKAFDSVEEAKEWLVEE